MSEIPKTPWKILPHDCDTEVAYFDANDAHIDFRDVDTAAHIVACVNRYAARPPRGRPKGWSKAYNDKFLELLAAGESISSMAKTLGVHGRTISNYKARHVEATNPPQETGAGAS